MYISYVNVRFYTTSDIKTIATGFIFHFVCCWNSLIALSCWNDIAYFTHIIMTISQPSLIDFAICGLTLITAVVPIYAASIIVACLSAGVWIGFRRWGKSLERRKRMRVFFYPEDSKAHAHILKFSSDNRFFIFYKTITHNFYYAHYTARVSSIVTLKIL